MATASETAAIDGGNVEACSTDLSTLLPAEDEALDENVVYETLYEVDAGCDTSVVEHSESAEPNSLNPDIAPMATTTTRVIHSSQTLQDVVNLDIARFRYAHETSLQSGTGLSYVKFNTWRLQGTWSGNLPWNHTTSGSFGSYTSSYTTAGAVANARGTFKSNFLWCNLQPGQNFTMYTELSRSPSSWNAYFSQSRTCSGTKMATAKKINSTRNLW